MSLLNGHPRQAASNQLGAEIVDAVFADLETAPVSEGLRAMLRLVETMTLRPDDLDAAGVDAVRAAGVGDGAIDDGLAVAAVFNVIDRLADAFGFDLPTEDEFGVMAQYLLDYGYAPPEPS